MNAPLLPRTDAGRDVVAGLLVFLATVAVFADAVHNDFVNYDDWGYVFDRRTLRGLDLENIKEAFTGVILGNYHPLAWLSHMLDVEVFGLDPRGHHAVSVVLHGAVAVVLLAILRRLGLTRVDAGVLALAFALHPLRVESVAWVAERKDVLCGFFYLLAVERWLTPDRSRWQAFVAGLLALLSKPMAVSLPPVLVIVDVFIRRRPWREALRDSAPLWALSVALAVITLRVQSGAMLGEDLVPLSLRLQTAVAAQAAIYLPATVAPTCLHAPYLYPEAWPTTTLLQGVALLVVALGVAAIAWRRAPRVTAGILWYGVAMAPVSGIIGVGIAPAADRYSYLPAVGLTLVAAGLVGLVSVRRPWVAPTLLAVWTAALLPQTLSQVSVWRTTRSLFEHANGCDGDNAHVLSFLGSMDLGVGELDRARTRTARAVALRPNLPDVWSQLGTICLAQGDAVCARDAFVESLSWRREDQAVAHTGLGVALLLLGDEAAGQRELGLGAGPLKVHGGTLAAVLARHGRTDLARTVRAQEAAGLASAPILPPHSGGGAP